jgi:phosphoesterase RecJ-like protein
MSAAIIPDQILQAINEKGNFVLLTHVHPDGDAIGSLLGMADLLDGMGKRVFTYLDEPVSHLYDFMPDCQMVSTNPHELSQFVREAGADVACIALDCGEADRLGELKQEVLKIHPFLVIDHHLSHRKYGDFRWVEPGRSSTGEMVFEIGSALGCVPSFNCAYNLYVAITTDTGSFRYECTGARTFEIASQLVNRGVQPDGVAKHLYDNFSPERLDLMQLVLQTLKLFYDKQVAVIEVTREMFDRTGAAMQDVEGFVDYPRSIRSVKAAVFIKEGRDDMISVSLRAKGECDVASIAKSFGGGGHRNAAGCRFDGEPLTVVRARVLAAIQASLEAGQDRNNG